MKTNNPRNHRVVVVVVLMVMMICLFSGNVDGMCSHPTEALIDFLLNGKKMTLW